MDIDRRVAGGSPTPALTEFLEQMGPYLRRLIATSRQAIALVATALAEEEKADHSRAIERGIILPALVTLERKLQDAVREFDSQQKKVLLDLYEKVGSQFTQVFVFTRICCYVPTVTQHMIG